MIFFESEQVIKLHSSLIVKTGGMDGVPFIDISIF